MQEIYQVEMVQKWSFNQFLLAWYISEGNKLLHKKTVHI